MRRRIVGMGERGVAAIAESGAKCGRAEEVVPVPPPRFLITVA